MSSGKELEGFDVAQIVCSMWNLITSPGTFKDFLIGFYRVTEDREGECTRAIKKLHDRFLGKISLEVVFCFAEHQ